MIYSKFVYSYNFYDSSRPILGYDLIGDIHGHLDALKTLLLKLGYRPCFLQNNKKVTDKAILPNTWVYRLGTDQENSRKIIFVGDLIDRGPKIRETLYFVKALVDFGIAKCVMGNHEFNAIGFWHQPSFRSTQSVKNIIGHSATIKAFQNRQDELLKFVDWFKTLPIVLELPGLRVVHAYWNKQISNFIQKDKKDKNKDNQKQATNNYYGDYDNNLIFTVDFENKKDNVVNDYSDEKLLCTPIYLDSNYNLKPHFFYSLPKECKKSVEALLKGTKIKLPDGHSYKDKDGNKRSSGRIKWWLPAKDSTYGAYIDQFSAQLSYQLNDIPLPKSITDNPLFKDGYSPDEKPIFFGHYWLRGKPRLQAHNVCCLDYSVAKGGQLLAYRWSGEKILKEENFVTHDKTLLNNDLNFNSDSNSDDVEISIDSSNNKNEYVDFYCIIIERECFNRFLKEIIINNIQTEYGLKHYFNNEINKFNVNQNLYEKLLKYLDIDPVYSFFE